MKLKDGLKKYENLIRQEYYDKNKELSRKLWTTPIPTIADIADFMRGYENEKMSKIFDFFENKEDFVKMINNVSHNYEQDESSAFIRKVMSANNDDISKAGYFYKLLMASADDILIHKTNCNFKGVEYNIEDLDESEYNYRVKFMYVKEYKNYMRLNYDLFKEWVNNKNIKTIHVRTPLTCNHFMQIETNRPHTRYFCKRCCGALPKNTINVGTFTTLMVTENATQSALSSMNKGRKENVNDVLLRRYEGERNFDAIKKWIADIVTSLKNNEVSARFYEIALLSRVRIDEKDGLPFVASMKSSISYSGNLFGSYIFTSNNKDFEKMIKAKEFEDTSLKLQIAVNKFDLQQD